MDRMVQCYSTVLSMGTSKMAGAESGAEIRDKVGAGAENIRFRDTAVLCLQVGSRS